MYRSEELARLRDKLSFANRSIADKYVRLKIYMDTVSSSEFDSDEFQRNTYYFNASTRLIVDIQANNRDLYADMSAYISHALRLNYLGANEPDHIDLMAELRSV